MLILILKVTTKKVTKKYTEMELRRESEQFARKTQTKKKAVMEELRNKKDIRHIENK